MLNERSRDMFESIKNVSDEITEYFNNRSYLIGVEEPESITDNELLVIAIDKLLNELEVMGIETNLDVDDLLTYGPYFDMTISMRRKFDRINLTNELKSLDTSSFADYVSIINDQRNSNDMLIETIEYMTDMFKLDIDWQRLTGSYERFAADSAFTTYLMKIIDQINSEDNNKTYVTDDNIETVSKFTTNMCDRDLKIQQMANYVHEHVDNISFATLQQLMRRYDKDKLNSEVLPLFAAYFVMDPKPAKEPAFVVAHHKRSNHHLEYWESAEHADEFITNEIACMIVFSMVLDKFGKDKRLQEVKKFFNYADKSVQAKLVELAGLDYETVLEGKKNAEQ